MRPEVSLVFRDETDTSKFREWRNFGRLFSGDAWNDSVRNLSSCSLRIKIKIQKY